MKKSRKSLLCLVLVLLMSFCIVGCGTHIATYQDVLEAEEKHDAGKMNDDEFYGIVDAYYNGDEIENDGIGIGTIFIVIIIAGVALVIINNGKKK